MAYSPGFHSNPILQQKIICHKIEMKNFTRPQFLRDWTSRILWLLLFMSSGAGCALAQAIRYVKQNGTGDGSTWEQASGSFQAMVDASAPGDHVWVTAGTYQPAAGQSFSMKEGVRIYGGFTGNETAFIQRSVSPDTYRSILLGNGTRVISNQGLTGASVIDGFTIKGGEGAAGAGMYNEHSSPVIANCIFTENRTSFAQNGGGILNTNSSPVIYNSVFFNNYGYRGGGISCNDNSLPVLYNCLIVNNVGFMGAGIYTYARTSPEFINCTVYNNISSGGMGGIYISESVRLTFKNTIIHSSATYLDLISVDPTVRLNCLLYQDPGFVNAAVPAGADGIFGTNDDGFRIGSYSSARNLGNNTYFPSVNQAADLARNPRIAQQNIDIGAYEYFEPASVSKRYVKRGGTGNGYTWGTASGDLQAMVNESGSGNEVWIAAGEYQPAPGQSFSMKEGVKIYGGFANSGTPAFEERDYATYVTTLKGNDARVITNNENNLTREALLDGFTIRNGNSGKHGGGMYNRNAYPTVSNCIFTNNQAAEWGGGVYNEGDGAPQFVNILFTGNTAEGGGAVFNYASKAVFTNVTITGNSATVNGGAYHDYQPQAATILRNSIIWNNASPGAKILSGGSITISHCLLDGGTGSVWGDYSASDVMLLDPAFVNAGAGDFRLSATSPAINAGNAGFFTDGSSVKDLSGGNRLIAGRIDIGAYEKQSFSDVGFRYVKQGSSGNGYSWASPSGDLQAMIDESESGNQVWVAAGEYQQGEGQFFSMKEGVKIYGGFANAGNPAMTDRNWTVNLTTLKGNGSHVIRNSGNGLTNAALLDGFTITGGGAQNGGGIYNDGSYPLINHCVFRGNQATQWGGGIYNTGPGMTVIANSLFYGNQAQSGGAAFSNSDATPRFTNVTIAGNTATENGGALHNYQGAASSLVNAIVWGNTQTSSSSQLYTVGPGETQVYFSVLEGGVKAIIGGKTGVDNVSLEPLFVDAANHDYRLRTCSPAINIGTAGVLNGLTTDLAGNTRIFNTIVDAGAYEYQSVSGTGADRLAVNGNISSVDVTPGQTYYIQVSGDVCRNVGVIESKGPSPISGNVTVTTWVDGDIQFHNGRPYVQRHYDISAAGSASPATARVTLYFTQEEFNAYNIGLGTNELPTGVSDNAGRGNVRIYQYHGEATNGNGPGNYEGAAVTIIPEVHWNYALARWELGFDVTGFSGFFVGSANAALPVKLVNFSGKPGENNTVLLEWQVSEQVDMSEYVIEYSPNGKDFIPIGSVPAGETAESRYRFAYDHVQPGTIAYYRLKMIGLDGGSTHSRIVSVSLSGHRNEVVAYPIPARDLVWVKGAGSVGSSLNLINIQGLVLKVVPVSSDNQEIDISALPAGIYFVRTAAGRTLRIIKE